MDVLGFFQRLCRYNFGDFDREELKKYLRMGLIFSLIVGVYWTLRPLKDALFIQYVGKIYLPYAKTVSLFALVPLVMLYTKIVSRLSREKMLVFLPAFYGITVIGFGLCVAYVPASVVQGYFFYVFVESFGSLVLASLFWAFATDTTDPESAKRGFPLVYALGQFGGIVFPYTIGGLPHRLGCATDALSLFILGLCILCIIPCVRYFFRATPASLIASYTGDSAVEAQEEPGFLEGLRMVVRHRYLLGIFTVISIYEIVVTIFDFNFKMEAGSVYSGVALSHYLSLYGSSVNVVSVLCLLLGISNITRFLGVGVALAAMPVIVGSALFGFLTLDSLTFLFIVMVGAKAINYALNGPTLKQLYVPTTRDVRFKAQAWIETFGSRAAKEAGSVFNMSLGFLQSVFGSAAGKAYYVALSGALGFPLLGLWFLAALFLGTTFRRTVREKSVVC